MVLSLASAASQAATQRVSGPHPSSGAQVCITFPLQSMIECRSFEHVTLHDDGAIATGSSDEASGNEIAGCHGAASPGVSEALGASCAAAVIPGSPQALLERA